MIERRRPAQAVRDRTLAKPIGHCSPHVEEIDVARLRPRKNNPRVHTARQINLIKRSLERFGFVNPALIDAENNIIAGHGRIEAAKQLGMPTVPVLRIEHLTEAEVRAYVIADNRLAEKSGWDRSLLAIELQELSEIGFDIDVIGFEPAELDILFDEAAEAAGTNGPDDLVPVIEQTPVSKPGSLWICGDHRVFCGNAIDQQDYKRLLGGKKAGLAFTDPPYNVPIAGHVSRRVRHAEFAMANGEMSPLQLITFLADVFHNMAAHSLDGSLHYVCMDWRHVGEIITAGQKTFQDLKNICVWCKTNAGMGSFYRSQHEFIFVWMKGGGAHVNNVELGRHGRSRSNVWTYAGTNSFRSGRDNELRMHPTVKPVALVADAIKDCSLRGAIVLDPFAGSGTTLIAAEKTGRIARAMEIEPRYVDVAVRRWQAYAGKAARQSDTGLTFEQVEDIAARPRSRGSHAEK
jgi:DNA modification methylase